MIVFFAKKTHYAKICIQDLEDPVEVFADLVPL